MKVSTQQYAKTLLALTENKSQEEVLNIVKKFAEQLKRDGQLKNSGKIMKKFAEIYDEKNGIMSTEVTSREQLSSKTISEIGDYIKKKYNVKIVEIKNIVDENIRGGVIIKARDEVLDGSVAAQLKKLKNILEK